MIVTPAFLKAFCLALALTEGHGRISFETNHREQAIGPHQIRPVLIREMHRLSPGYNWKHNDASTYHGSCAIVSEWVVQMNLRHPELTPEDLAHAWNAGPDLYPPCPGYRKRFTNHFTSALKENQTQTHDHNQTSQVNRCVRRWYHILQGSIPFWKG